MDYVKKHEKMLRRVTKDGALITFSKHIPGEYDPGTSTFTQPTTLTVDGAAVEIPGDPEEYAELDLLPLHPVTLIFVPTTYGELPPVEGTAIWANVLRTIRHIFPFRPDGSALAARVVLT